MFIELIVGVRPLAKNTHGSLRIGSCALLCVPLVVIVWRLET